MPTACMWTQVIIIIIVIIIIHSHFLLTAGPRHSRFHGSGAPIQSRHSTFSYRLHAPPRMPLHAHGGSF